MQGQKDQEERIFTVTLTVKGFTVLVGLPSFTGPKNNFWWAF